MRRFLQRLPESIRLPALTAIYGIVGGLATVAFMLAVNRLFLFVWHKLTAMGTLGFILGSLSVIAISSVASGILMASICPQAAGSGIPQLKAAYWTELGAVPFRAVFVKFVGGLLALAGGASLGREGPTVFIAGGLCSNVAGWLGIDRRRRRHATASGAAAGLAAAFNTPLAAISFVLEEILGDLNSRLLGSVVLASVCGAFVVYALVGKQPSFAMPSVDAPSWKMYFVVPIAAALGALAGVVFQRGSLALRRRMRELRRVPSWLHPLAGGLVTWVLGCAAYVAYHRLGVFGLGYEDLSDALLHGIGWKVAAVLAVAKLIATIASYGTGGCGGIFSPTLFIGAMCGFFVAGVARHWLPLTIADELVLAATGMSACFGAVVRAPFTAILMIFEMTHQFGMVPALMLGTLISQGVARLAGRGNFYDAVLLQDGHEIHRIAPPRDLVGWRSMPISALANRKPVAVLSLAPDALQAALSKYPYRCFPVIIAGALRGVVTREELEHALARGVEPRIEKPMVCLAGQSLQEVEPRMIESAAGLFLVAEAQGGPITGIFTLHDLLRAQASLLD
jgi:chloride channel protein, CIC family